VVGRGRRQEREICKRVAFNKSVIVKAQPTPCIYHDRSGITTAPRLCRPRDHRRNQDHPVIRRDALDGKARWDHERKLEVAAHELDPADESGTADQRTSPHVMCWNGPTEPRIPGVTYRLRHSAHPKETDMQDFAVIGLDLAISVFRVHGVGRAASASSWNALFYTSGT
jgi:hypothetical protein